MKLNAGSLFFLSIAAFSSLASAQAIAFGQELQEGDQTNHWVTWIDGKNACPGQQILGVLTKSPCDQPFNFGEVEYTLSGCSGETNSPPTVILDSDGLQIGGCTTAHSGNKINCKDGLHDIVKHGTCVIINGV
ncbi:hypothetical protein F4820DRAFT_62287 [Hypoxylon rubiginosum]|uniref:Uncharacterized protein n=1 Tax=Hypoxylon rubiginosum TaxID=110542 RepID=A0ACB9ZC50_9PEZI|nr:hypothetical protein F4820DRAFT_62287 [Hypoxylon rubiginosum]